MATQSLKCDGRKKITVDSVRRTCKKSLKCGHWDTLGCTIGVHNNSKFKSQTVPWILHDNFYKTWYDKEMRLNFFHNLLICLYSFVCRVVALQPQQQQTSLIHFSKSTATANRRIILVILNCKLCCKWQFYQRTLNHLKQLDNRSLWTFSHHSNGRDEILQHKMHL